MRWIDLVLAGMVVVGWVWMVVWTVKFRKALGARWDWKRRFENMKKALKI